MGVRCDAKHSIHEGTHLRFQVGEGGHARGEGRDVVFVERQPVGGNEWDVLSIKRIHLLPQPCHLRQPRGYRGDLVVTETQPVGVKRG
mgnify:CR=1 FL=1